MVKPEVIMNATLQEMRKVSSALMAKVENMAIFQNSSELGLGQEALAFSVKNTLQIQPEVVTEPVMSSSMSKIAQLRNKFVDMENTSDKKYKM